MMNKDVYKSVLLSWQHSSP